MKRQGRLDEALDFYNRAIELDPANSVILYNTGVLLNICSEFEQAVSTLQASIRNNPNNV